jgi:hypothetical protein
VELWVQWIIVALLWIIATLAVFAWAVRDMDARLTSVERDVYRLKAMEFVEETTVHKPRPTAKRSWTRLKKRLVAWWASVKRVAVSWLNKRRRR